MVISRGQWQCLKHNVEFYIFYVRLFVGLPPDRRCLFVTDNFMNLQTFTNLLTDVLK